MTLINHFSFLSFIIILRAISFLEIYNFTLNRPTASTANQNTKRRQLARALRSIVFINMAQQGTSSPAAVVGSTGLVGSHILATLLSLEKSTPVHTFTRRAPNSASPHLETFVNTDTSTWAPALTALPNPPTVVFSALGTTRGQAGSYAAQWKIDHDLNVEMAKAAKAAGAKTFVFCSGAATNGVISSRLPYSQMKNGVEKTIKELDFEHGIILKPGFILGQREKSRGIEGIAQSVVSSFSVISLGFRDAIGQDANVIARAGVKAAMLAEQGKAPSKYWVLESADIIRLGRAEWNEGKWTSIQPITAL